MLLLIGIDAIRDLHLWYEPRRVLELAGLLVVERPENSLRTARNSVDDSACMRDAVRMQLVHAPLIDISSHDLRRRAADGRSLRYLTPRAVECYIHDKRLYRTEAPA